MEHSPAQEARSGQRQEGEGRARTQQPKSFRQYLSSCRQRHFLTLPNTRTKQKQDLPDWKTCTELPVHHMYVHHIRCSALAVPAPQAPQHCLGIVDPPSWSMNSLVLFLPVNKAGPEHPAAAHQHNSWHSFALSAG